MGLNANTTAILLQKKKYMHDADLKIDFIISMKDFMHLLDGMHSAPWGKME